MVQPNSRILPNGDNPRRNHKSYFDKQGLNPVKNSFDNCFIRTRLGTDPITNLPISVFDEQINRERQILESLGELCKFFRLDITPDKNIVIDGTQGARCPLCYDPRRGQARANCSLCNGSGIITRDPNITKVSGFELIQNPDRADGLFFTHGNMSPQKVESKDIGFNFLHSPTYWTIPVKNSQNSIVNYLNNKDCMIRYIMDPISKKPIRELERLVIMEMNYSLGPNNQLLHFSWTVEKAQPYDNKYYALPNGL